MISRGSLIFVPSCSQSTHFPQKIWFRFCLHPAISFYWLDVFHFVQFCVIQHDGNRRSGVNGKFLFHVVYLQFDTVMVAIVRQYFVDLCYPADFLGFTFLFVFFWGPIVPIVYFSWVALRFSAAYPCKVSYFLAIVAFYRFWRTVVFGCPVCCLQNTQSFLFGVFPCSRCCLVWIFWIGSCFILLVFCQCGRFLCRRS